jgi:hypothetical protein
MPPLQRQRLSAGIASASTAAVPPVVTSTHCQLVDGYVMGQGCLKCLPALASFART